MSLSCERGIHAGIRTPSLSVQLLPPGLEDEDRKRFLNEARALEEAGVRLVFLPDSPRGDSSCNPIAAATLLEQKSGLRCIPHLNSRDRNRIAIEAELMAACHSGVRGIKLVSGMPLAASRTQVVYELDSCEMVELAQELGIEERLEIVVGFTLGENPEKSDRRLRRKLEAGARYVLTTPTLDATALEAFLDRHPDDAERMIIGLSPSSSPELLERMRRELPFYGVPEGHLERLRAASGDDERRRIATSAVSELIDRVGPRGVAGFHLVPPLGRVRGAMELVHSLQGHALLTKGEA